MGTGRSARVLVALALLAGLLAGCGGKGKPKPDLADARAEALAYFPRDPALLAVVATDPDTGQVKALRDLIGRFPGNTLALAQVEDMLKANGLDYADDVRPLLGNDAVIGAPATTATALVLVLPVRDEGKLEDLLARRARQPGVRALRLAAGARIVVDSAGRALADRNGVLLASTSIAALRAAVARRLAGGGYRPRDLAAALGAQPATALVRAVGDVARLLGPGAPGVRTIPWVAALRTFAATVTVSGDGLRAALRVDTPGGRLTAGDLPFATGPRAPSPAGAGPIAIGLRNPAHLVAFLERALEQTGRVTGTELGAAKTLVRLRYGLDIDSDLVDRLRGDAAIETDLNSFAARVDLRDPRAMEDALGKLHKALPPLLGAAGIGGIDVRRTMGGLYQITSNGRPLALFGVVAGKLVAGNVSAARLRSLATAPRAAVPGATGSVVVRIPGERLAALIADRLGLGGIGQLALARLGDLTAWLRSEVGGLSGAGRLAIR